jgi:hypothetical protein
MRTKATISILFLLIIFLLPVVHGQISTTGNAPDNEQAALMPMSTYDSVMLSSLPPLRLSKQFNRGALPMMVDNSALPYFRPLIAQVGLECGQSASIGNMLTYELNVLRNAPGDQPQNQLATHFTYNFLNGGSNAGISYYETFEIVKRLGNPTVQTYGGIANGGASRWMSGYTNYYNSMHNRIHDIYSIKTNTIEGLETLKQWIYDHGKGSQYGGTASFYAEFSYPPTQLPQGTPEAGKHVIIQWGNSANHAMTIVGYHDSIRWDYNNDNQYTNHLDINGDGIVDVRDWEIGGFKMANTYGSISGWGDEGFSYMMYKTVADRFQQGGIWNNVVVVTDASADHQPLLTAKATITYPCRNKLKIMIGMSTNPGDTEPEYTLNFPVFDYQGGCNPMQGSGQSETIEFGLDLNPLLSYIIPGQSVKIFLMVYESDASGEHSGMINKFSIIDYTNGQTEIEASGGAGISNNTLTMMSVVAAFGHNPVVVSTQQLPPLQLYESYSHNLQASGGTPPYRWAIADDYIRFDSVAAMPAGEGIKLDVSNNNSGMAKVNLPFDFPFYGKKYNAVYATVDGYIRFDESLIPWPYYIDGRSYFLQNKTVAPLMSNTFVVTPSEGDGIWYEEGEGYCSFTWKLSVAGQTNTSETNFKAILYEDGRIVFHYGYQNIPFYIRRYGGISSGDGENYVLMNTTGTFNPLQLRYNRFVPMTNVTGLELSVDGVLSGDIEEFLDQVPIRVSVTDNNKLKSFKTFYLSTEGVLMEAEVYSEPEHEVVYGESFGLDLIFTNLNSFSLSASEVQLSTSDPYFHITEHLSGFPPMAVGEQVFLQNIFAVNTDRFVPHGYKAKFLLSINAPEGNWSRDLTFTAQAPVVEMASMLVDDGNNGILEPGETANLVMNLYNAGGADVTTAMAVLTSAFDGLTVGVGTAQKEVFGADSIWQVVYQVSLEAGSGIPPVIGVNLHVIGDKEFSYYHTYPIIISQVIEDFESGNFGSFDWLTGGNAPWYADNQAPPFEGSFAARSGVIYDNQSSSLSIDYDVAFPDSLSFYFKVSSEYNYDFLHFLINGVEQSRWSGEEGWKRYSVMLASGAQTLSWLYTKDYSVSNGEDCAKIDYIIFPAYTIPTFETEVSQDDISLILYPNPASDQLTVSFTASGKQYGTVSLLDRTGKILWFTETSELLSGDNRFYPPVQGLPAGVYFIMASSANQILVRKFIKIR